MTGLHRLLRCVFWGHLLLEPNSYSFAMMMVSLTDLPLLYDIDVGFTSFDPNRQKGKRARSEH